ncbi:MAG TPA: molybdopterin-dependent oxidoreductase [Gemmatales bacterium]|nr:molybdopterin-dependent oxidoreductase [Gemmatales bacterium]
MQHEQYDALTRREWLATSSLAGLALAGCQQKAATVVPTPTKPRVDAPFDQMLQFKDKVPMRAINDRPPCLETPWEYFKHDLTPNEAFYVRWHLQTLPTIDEKAWKLKVGGHVDKSVELSLADIRKLPSTSIVAVNQCSGNSRGLFTPPIPGAQWGNGAMSNARWTGVKLADVLKLAGVKTGALEVTFAGLDKGGPATVPDYVKSIPLAEALKNEVLLAYNMNGVPLPVLNGFPIRLVVPGWFATYWVKAIGEINVINKPFDGYWVQKAYRIPKGNLVDKPGDLAKETIPIHKMLVRSFFVLPGNNSTVPAGKPVQLDGIAFDGGSGIKAVELSEDGGKTWKPTQLGEDLGKYSFRRWRQTWTPEKAGDYRLLVRATANSGETQPMQPSWNRAGYLRNHVEAWDLKAS